MRISRRSLIELGAAGAAGSLLTIPNEALVQTVKSKKRPKNVIFCVSDGMPMSAITMADYYQRLSGKKSSYWAWLMKQEFVHNGLQETRSLNSLVTDSAAASSSWGSGCHIVNGQLNTYPDKTELRTLFSLVQEKKVRTGLVTTATITHATPAGFSIACHDRDLEGLIAERYLALAPDILMGGGNKFFAADKRPDKKDLYAEFEKKGYKVVKSRKEIIGLKAPKLLGIYSDSHVPYTVDRDNDPELISKVPTLAEMATVALDNLKGSRNGFLLQIEGAKIDHGGHANDLAAVVFDQIAFEEAVKVAVDFAQKDGETLVVITADHATGGSALNGAGLEYADSTAGLMTLAGMKSTYAPLLSKLSKAPSAADVQDVVNANLGIKFKDEEAQIVADSIAGKHLCKGSIFYGNTNSTLAIMLGNYTKVTWTSLNHTCDHVMVTALGPWSEKWHGLTENISYFDKILSVWDIKHKNPVMTWEDAKKAMEKKPVSQEEHEELRALYGAGEDMHSA